ncbi:MAG: hypothetical protein A2146_03325 [Actinobacteria bacterium RBG_16_67_10]|nr:MAG: hypothetical protein A2146_03325 [Actinobacteria bacterium RBG_16_67_10]
MRVVDDDQDRSVDGCCPEQRKRRSTDCESIAGRRHVQRERTAQRGRLGRRYRGQVAQDRCRQVGKSREQQCRLRLAPGGREHTHPARASDGLGQ